MTTTIQFDQSGESQVFLVTRDVRNSDHANGTIEAGERVFFRTQVDGAVALMFESGEPTNGSEFATFASVGEAEEFASRVGLSDGSRGRPAF